MTQQFQRAVAVGQECGSILAYSQLDNQHMARDPVIPNPPNHMKIVGREQLPRFNAQSLGEFVLSFCKIVNKPLSDL